MDLVNIRPVADSSSASAASPPPLTCTNEIDNQKQSCTRYDDIDPVSKKDCSERSNGSTFKKNSPIRIDKTAAKIQKVAPVTYHSQISGDKNAIKIRIRKSNASSKVEKKRHRGSKKSKHKHKARDSDANNNPSAVATQEQSRWAYELPSNILYNIFNHVCTEIGAVPSLVRFSRVCKLWRNVAVDVRLWKCADLGLWTKQKFMSDQTLHWILANRLTNCEDLNLNDWKAVNISQIFSLIKDYCSDLKSLSLGGWINLTADQLKYIVTECPKLRNIDLSSINELKINGRSAVNVNPLISFAEIMGERLTSLNLSHNKLTGLPQIVNAISETYFKRTTNVHNLAIFTISKQFRKYLMFYIQLDSESENVNIVLSIVNNTTFFLIIKNFCPNLELLDLSNIEPFAHTIPSIDIEKFQQGCPKLRVLRITNSQILLASSSLSEQAASPGFPLLEELSLAGVDDEQTTSKFIDDNGLDRILKTSRKLRLLDVRGCTKITGSGLVKIPAWDIQHLFLSASSVTRCDYMGLGLVIQKWSHSVKEVDLSWSISCDLDAAVINLAETSKESILRKLDLCGSSVSVEPIKKILQNCHQLQSINLQSCRGLPRGIKRLYQGNDLIDLKNALNKSEFESSETDNDDQQKNLAHCSK